MASRPSRRLAGKVIAFVDDRYDINRYFFDAIRNAGGELQHCNTIRQACLLFEASSSSIDAAVLDLHMSLPDPVPDVLEQFTARIRGAQLNQRIGVLELNAGQVLGIYINARPPARRFPFVYLSAVADSFVQMQDAQAWRSRDVLDKYEIEPEELVELLEQMVSDAAGTVQ